MTQVNLTAKASAQPKITAQAAANGVNGNNTSLTLIAGDDWTFIFTVLAADGSPVDLTNATVSWTLCDENGYRVIQPSEIDVIKSSPSNIVNVEVPGEVTTRLPQNSFVQALRVIDENGLTTTPYMGVLWVTADPWAIRTSLVNWESGLVPPRSHL